MPQFPIADQHKFDVGSHPVNQPSHTDKVQGRFLWFEGRDHAHHWPVRIASQLSFFHDYIHTSSPKAGQINPASDDHAPILRKQSQVDAHATIRMRHREEFCRQPRHDPLRNQKFLAAQGRLITRKTEAMDCVDDDRDSSELGS
jgi:hypothetical protein